MFSSHSLLSLAPCFPNLGIHHRCLSVSAHRAHPRLASCKTVKRGFGGDGASLFHVALARAVALGWEYPNTVSSQ